MYYIFEDLVNQVRVYLVFLVSGVQSKLASVSLFLAECLIILQMKGIFDMCNEVS